VVRDHDTSGVTFRAETIVDHSRWIVALRKNSVVNMNTDLNISARFKRR